MFWNNHNLIFLSAKSKFRMNAWKSCLSYICLLYFLVFHIDTSLAACNITCVNGYCDTGDECVCFTGWEGDNCDHCDGRVRLLESSGYIYESPENYKPNKKCSWLIDSQRFGTPIHLKLEEFGTECSWDHLYIYDGDSIYSPLVAALSGPVQYQEEDIRLQFTLTSGFAYLYFYSDAAYILDGFNISYSYLLVLTYLVPDYACIHLTFLTLSPRGSIGDCRSRNCSGNGICQTANFTCECFPGWSGDDCTIPDCPNNCTMGNCINGQCVCDNGYYGRDCNTETSEGLWEIQDQSTVFSRASAASVVIGDEVWLIGGYGFVKEDSMPVFKYNFTSGVSKSVPVTSSSGRLPLPRYAHSAVLYKERIIVYGGSIVDGAETSEIWLLNTITLSWLEVRFNHGEVEALQGHTAHVFNGSMLVFFGYSPTYDYVGWVQEYNILDHSWSILETKGFPALGAFGHSSVYSQEMQKVFVYGGYPFSRLGSLPGDPFYEFDLIEQKWSILPSAMQPRFLHSAVLIGHKMYVFGGNSHTDSNEYRGAQCYSNSFMIYDIDCNSWYEEDLSSGLDKDISRFGHQAVLYNDDMWLFGGYNGVMLNDVITYTTVNCSSLSNGSCELAGPGPTCMWDMDSEECIRFSEEEISYHNISFLECDPTESYGIKGIILVIFRSQTIQHVQTRAVVFHVVSCKGVDGVRVDVVRIAPMRTLCFFQDEFYTCNDLNCQFYKDCDECNRYPQCRFTDGRCSLMNPSVPPPSTFCGHPCSTSTSCSECVKNSNYCMWCESQNRCIDSQTYLTSFIYGTCLAWVTGRNGCNKIRCSDYEDCDMCLKDPACGWCGDVTGLGTCMEGSDAGPINVTSDDAVVDLTLCPSSLWYFTDCPLCLCNGHSICLDGETCSNCGDFTTGEQCESCIPGYHGTPLDGANCSACECNGHSEYCDPSSDESICYCDTRGIVGAQCDRCALQYYGDPTVNTCYSQLMINYIYTIGINSESEINITKTNLFAQPEHHNRDIIFTLTVYEAVNFSVSYITREFCKVEKEEIIIDNIYVESVFTHRFSRSTYDFSKSANTTFLFYISNFTTPFTYRIKIVQQPNFIAILASFMACVVFILTVFVVALKGREHFYRYRRRRQREVELVEMARRPFASIFLEIENNAPPDLIATTKFKPSTSVGLATEPLKDSKAALATIIMQLPLVDGEVPIGQSRITFATALVNQKSKKTDSHQPIPENREPPTPRETPRGQTQDERPNTARDIELTCDETSPDGEYAYDNPVVSMT
ncbi:Attractin [Holothuria leucospilota]|uniref:Attractin n=1 Tax=Holothuria leucospilota TaxID=206669 RepID=A0A9Q1BHS0_HOLLE|nr:Attractin [Holothuria leucospilota]